MFSTFQRMNKVCVKWVSRCCAQLSEKLLEKYGRESAKNFFTTRYSEWNVDAQLRFWVRTTKHAMERTNL